jgi:magnesium-protoporphyrin O-methyltransferase
MNTQSYRQRRAEIAHYFDHTATEAWSRLTSNSPVGPIRRTVRAGRDAMRAILLERMGSDLRGLRVLDAGCGTGALSVEAARRGAEVLAIDISPRLIALAQERAPAAFDGGSIEFRVGDMLDASLGSFDHVVAMDSLIHYRTDDAVAALAGLARNCRASIQFTFAPSTPMLELMHAVGRWFPRGNRAPAIVPVRETALAASIAREPMLAAWSQGRSQHVKSGFYQSQAYEIVKR